MNIQLFTNDKIGVVHMKNRKGAITYCSVPYDIQNLENFQSCDHIHKKIKLCIVVTYYWKVT